MGMERKELMEYVTYDKVVELADQLTPDERQALIAYLQERSKQHELTSSQWNMLFDAMKISVPLGDTFSLRREDWYDDDGR
jgi:hypothetical protein